MDGKERARSGRPRDPEIDAKVLLAAQRVYTQGGRSALTFESVAREAGVGKPAIYRRWESTDALMGDVMRSHILVPVTADSADIRAQLCEIAMSVLQLVSSEQGSFILRLSSERAFQSALFDQYFERVRDVIHTANRGLIVAAIERGELLAQCDPDALLHAVTGSVLVASLMGFATPPADDREGAERYCSRLVDQILRGALPRTA